MIKDQRKQAIYLFKFSLLFQWVKIESKFYLQIPHSKHYSCTKIFGVKT